MICAVQALTLTQSSHHCSESIPIERCVFISQSANQSNAQWLWPRGGWYAFSTVVPCAKVHAHLTHMCRAEGVLGSAATCGRRTPLQSAHHRE
jgi:hypothetical protein